MIDIPLPVTLFADFTSPFCYVTEVGIDRLARTRPIEIERLAFELHPAPTPLPAHDPAELARADPLAREVEIELRAPDFLPRTRKAHEAVRYAQGHGLRLEMRRALYAAYWEQERDIGRIDVLMEVAAGLGMDPTELKITLDIDVFSAEVAAELALAQRLRVHAVPTLYLGRGPSARILMGARTLAALDEALAAG